MYPYFLRCLSILTLAALLLASSHLEASVLKLHSLPDVLRGTDGTKVEHAHQWTDWRQQEIRDLFAREYFGIPPVERPADLTFTVIDSGTANSGGTRYSCRISYSGPYGSNEMIVHLWIPNNASASNPVPTIVLNNHRRAINAQSPSSSFYPVSTILARGYATLYVYNAETSLDVWTDFFTNGAHEAFDDLNSPRGSHEWGTLRAWAWGVSLGIDWLETFPELDIDRTVSIGHSRGSKTSALVAANDERIALCLVNSGGMGVTALMRDITDGESISRMNTSFPHWLNNYAKKFSQEPYKASFDLHWWMAQMAPRRLYIGNNRDDQYADIRNSYNSLVEASVAYELLGLAGLPQETRPAPDNPLHSGSIAYHERPTTHRMDSTDWRYYMDYMDAIWADVTTSQEARLEKGTAVIPDNGSYTDDSLVAGQSRSIPFALRNTGRTDLSVIGPVNLITTNCHVTVVTTPASTITPDRITTIELAVTPTSAGPWSVEAAVATNDSDESTYNWTVQGAATANTPTPRAMIYHGHFLPVDDGGGAYLVDTIEDIESPEVFTLVNEGDAPLTFSELSIGQQQTVDSRIIAQPTQLSLAPGESTTFTLGATPRIPSPWNFDVQFTTNDPDRSTYDFNVKGSSFVAELVITREGVEIPNNSIDTLEGMLPGVPVDVPYILFCEGAQSRIVPVQPYFLSTVNCVATLEVIPSRAIIAAGTSAPLTLRVTPQSSGFWSVQVNFHSSDYDENAVEWTLQGVAGSLPSGSEIGLFGEATAVPDGGSVVMTGTNAGSPSTLSLNIFNTGADPLTINQPITTSGIDARITVSGAPASSVPSLGSTSIELSITPEVVGPWSGSVSIPNNDSDESPYLINISGTAGIPVLDLDAPSSVSATANSANQVELTWVNAADDAEGFEIERREVTSSNSFEVILDQDADGVVNTGFWPMTFGQQQYGTTGAFNFFADPASPNNVRYTPDLSNETGTYEVYIWYGTLAEVTNAPVTVTESGVATTVTVDQTQNTGQWVLIGEYYMEDGDSVTIEGGFTPSPSGTAGRVLADAVRFFKPVSGGPWTQVAALDEGTATSYTDNTTTGGVHYEYRIRPINRYADGDWSGNASATTPESSGLSYFDWAQGETWGGNPSADTADPDSDGFSNKEEYALYGDPMQLGALMQMQPLEPGDPALVIEFDRRRDIADAIIELWVSTDLSDWSLHIRFPASGSVSANAITEIVSEDAERQRLRVKLPLGTAGGDFIDLRVL